MQIKIGDSIFNCLEGIVQVSLGSHATLNLKFDLDKYPNYEKFFIKMYESNTIFKIISSNFESVGSKIKSLDIDFSNKKMELSIHADILNSKDLSVRREEVINEILQKTFKDDKDIN